MARQNCIDLNEAKRYAHAHLPSDDPFGIPIVALPAVLER